VRVRSPQATRLRELLLQDGVTVTGDEPGVLEVDGLDAAEIGYLGAAVLLCALLTLVNRRGSPASS
jgi:ABC-2 type transport system ATP-binding protein